jgi:predicted nuclease of predicted toxin-antitoxin system
MKILVDMNLSPAWIEFLVAAGFDARHWSQVGPGDAHDAEVMRWAAAHDHIVLTSDLDFGAILAATQGRWPNVIQLRSEVLAPDAAGAAVIAALHKSHRELTEGALVSVDAASARLRVLPLSGSSE